MPVIQPRTRGKHMERHVCMFDRESEETLFAYAAFLGNESISYVLTQVIDTVLARDRDYLKWRAEHPQAYVPPRQPRRGRCAPRSSVSRMPLTEGTPSVHAPA